MPPVPQCSTIYLVHVPIITTFLHYVIISLYSNITSSCRETEFKIMLFSYIYDGKLRVKQVCKKTCFKLTTSKNCRMSQEWISLFPHWKLLHIKVVSHFHYYSCTATTLSCQFRNIEVKSNDGSHLDCLDALEHEHSSLFDGLTMKKYSVTFFPNFNKYFVAFMH